jgi:hypothetical protein
MRGSIADTNLACPANAGTRFVTERTAFSIDDILPPEEAA